MSGLNCVTRIIFLCLALGLLLSCNDGNGGCPAVSLDGDGDSNESDKPNPCLAYFVNCHPGTCTVDDGVALCICPPGYRSQLYQCRPLADGDDDQDADPMETDTDHEIETEGDTDSGTGRCVPATHGLFKDIPCCTDKDSPTPCMDDLPFEYTNDEGEFKIGPSGVTHLDLHGIWNGYILLSISQKPYYGLYLFDFHQKRSVRIAPPTVTALYATIGYNRIVWEDINGDLADVWTTTLTTLSPKYLFTVADSPHLVKIIDEYIFYTNKGDLYEMPIGGTPQQLNARDDFGSYFATNGQYVFWERYDVLIRYDRAIAEKKVVAQIGRHDGRIYMNDDTVCYMDMNDAAPNALRDCGSSMRAYSIQTGSIRTLKKTTGHSDYIAQDIWKNWLVYANCDEPNLEEEDIWRAHCCYWRGNADIYLMNLETEQEWRITEEFGRQFLAKMDGPIIAWLDGRENRRGYWDALYGVDLCRHPQLSAEFEMCESR